MKPIAIVIPWFGDNLTGGAEQQAFQIATRLASRGHAVEVLTTCNLSFESDWAINHHPEGTTEEFGLTIRRFPVEPREAKNFDRVNEQLLSATGRPLRRGVSPVSPEDTEVFVHENIKSKALLEHLKNNGATYHGFIFLPYMFAPTTVGLPLVADRAWLQPCLHNEAQAYFPQTAALFRAARGLLFNSSGEFELALQLYGPGIYTRSAIVGEGIEYSDYAPDVLTAALPPELRAARFVLYLGRRDRAKNVHLLVQAFDRFKASHPQSLLRLVLAGTGSESFASNESISEMGFVTGEMKAALLANCVVLAQPSTNESFSRVLMEVWTAGRPAAVHGECLATSTAVREARAGWTPATLEQWTELFEHLETESTDALNELGQRGREYASDHADWEAVIARYESLMELNGKARTGTNIQRRQALKAIHQLLPDFAYGDAISNQAKAIRDQLRRLGYSSDIFSKRRAKRVAADALLLDERQPEPGSALVYHYGIGSDVTAIAVGHDGPRALVYHNITPASYFMPYRPGFSWMLEVGRINLKRLARYFPVSVADSAYNASELAAYGFQSPRVLPIIIDPDRWNIEPAEHLLKRLQDGRTNLLFTGRLAPNKKQDQLIETLAHYLKLDGKGRLIIAGEGRAFDPYFLHIVARCRELKLEMHVEVAGQIDDAELLAYYHTAHLFWSASEHEGFGAPLVEAMWFDIPVLALGEAAVPETLADAGVIYHSHESLPRVAERAYQLINDDSMRRQVIAEQRLRRRVFTAEAIAPRIQELCELLEAGELESLKAGER
jgi:glycosyltransferase involved in cell wall biosynthesis